MEFNNLVALAKKCMGGNSSTPINYSNGDKNVQLSYDAANAVLREELNKLAGTYADYRKNKNVIFELIEEAITDVLPKKVLESYGTFAEVKTYKQGDRPVFTQRITMASKRRAKRFVTKVGLAGVYEIFKLDGQSYEVKTSAFGGAYGIGLEEFLDGRIDLADVSTIIMEGLDEAVYLEIQRALVAATSTLQEGNKYTGTAFVEKEMDKLLSVADSYGQSTIYCTYEFAATMLPAEAWVSDRMKDEIWSTGYFTKYKNHNVIILPQSYEDETNTVKTIDPSFAWIIPIGAEKPVKVAFEGGTLIRERENEDWSRDVQVYKKLGVAAIITNNICVYRNTSLKVTD